MALDLEKLGQALEEIKFDPRPEVNADMHVPIRSGTVRVTMTKPEYDLWMKAERTFGSISDAMREIAYYINVAGGVAVAYQEITVAAGDLTTTVVSNDTLITASQSNVEFNWNDPRLEFGRSVNLEPALGVEQMGFVLDTGAHINPAVLHSVDGGGNVTHNLQMDCCTPAPGEPTHLIRRNWVNTGGVWDLDPVAWTVGQVLHLSQLVVMEATAL